VGERGAYRVVSPHEKSPFLRKQWCEYETVMLVELVKGMARVLCSTHTFQNIGKFANFSIQSMIGKCSNVAGFSLPYQR